MLLRLASALLFAMAAPVVMAHDHDHSQHAAQVAGETSPHRIAGAWSRAMPPTAPTGAVYFTVENTGQQPDRLLGAYTQRAGRTELHTHIHEGEVMRMQQVDSVELPAGSRVEFKPGGNHVMLFDLRQPLNEGERFSLTLKFEHAGDVPVEVSILEDAPQGSEPAHAHH